MDVVVNGKTPEQGAPREIFYGEGGLASAQRTIANAPLENLPKVIELQTRDMLTLARQCGVPETEVYDGITESVVARDDMDPDALQAILARAASAAAKLLRAYTSQIEALRRLQNGGSQFVRVEHVHVNEGGQAVIGNVGARSRE